MLTANQAVILDFIRQTVGERREGPHSLSMHVNVAGAEKSITTTVLKITPRWDALLQAEEKEKNSIPHANQFINELLTTFPMYSGEFIVNVLEFMGGIKGEGIIMGRKDDMFYFHDKEHCVAFWYTDDNKTGDFFLALEKNLH